MSILSGNTLKIKYPNIVTPFIDHKEIAHGMSYGLSLAGYDIRIAGDLVLGSDEFCITSSIEEFNMPRNVMGFIHDKSSWARSGLSLYNTVLEPGWKGFLTLELFNAGMLKRIQAGTPIAQVIFMYIDDVTEGYNGKYQNAPEGPQEAIYEHS